MSEETEKANERQPWPVQVAEALVLFSAFGYWIVYMFERGFSGYFHIDQGLTEISLNSVFRLSEKALFVPIVGLVVCAVYPFAFVGPGWTRKWVTGWGPLGLVSAISVVAAPALWRQNLPAFIGVIVVSSLAAMLFDHAEKRLTRNAQSGPNRAAGALDGAAEQTRDRLKLGDLQRMMRLSRILLIVCLGVQLGFIARSAGESDARMQRDFLVRRGSPDLVVLGVYGGRAICGRLDRESRSFSPEFSILPLDSDPPLSFKLEEVGPLTPAKAAQPATSGAPTTVPAAPTTSQTEGVSST
jgi:hypothetical protein